MKIKRFTGLNNVDEPMDVGLSGLTIARNVDIDRNGAVSSRQGRVKLQDVNIVASWSDKSTLLVVTGTGELMRLQGDSLVKIADVQGDTLAAVEINKIIYFSTNQQSGVIDGAAVRDMGVPYALPFATHSQGGNLSAGRYMVNAIAVAPDGRESGAMDSFLIDVPDNSKITITASVPAGHDARLYISGRDGEQLYHVGNGSEITVSEPFQNLSATEPLDRIYKGVMPFASYMDEYQGCLLAASDNFLFTSDALDYELFDLVDSVIPFDSEIVMLRSVNGGFFVGTGSEVYFMTGEAGSWTVREAYRYGVVKGSDQVVDLSLFGKGELGGKGVLFLSEKGMCIAVPGGGVTNLTERKIAIPKLNRVSSLIDGSRYVVALP